MCSCIVTLPPRSKYHVLSLHRFDKYFQRFEDRKVHKTSLWLLMFLSPSSTISLHGALFIDTPTYFHLFLTSSTNIPPLGRMAAPDKPRVNGHLTLMRVCVCWSVRVCVCVTSADSQGVWPRTRSASVSLITVFDCVSVCVCVGANNIPPVPPCHVRSQQML